MGTSRQPQEWLGRRNWTKGIGDKINEGITRSERRDIDLNEAERYLRAVA